MYDLFESYMCKRCKGSSSKKKYLFANNDDWFLGYGVESIVNLMNLTNERNKKLNFFTDPILIKINCNQKLSLNKMTLNSF